MLESSASFDNITISARKQNLLKRQKINENEDMMNKLPEPLISRILSLLPTKDAVRTSVLSKKWVFRWTFITKLALDDTVFYSPKKKTGVNMSFTNFVYRVLLLTQSIRLESFSLVIANQYDASLLNTCISSILRRNVKSLHIRTRFKMPVSSFTSHSLFSSTLLEELVLNMESCAIRVAADYVYFGLLRLLKLSGISFTPDPTLNCLKLSLPVLKVFESTNCSWLNVKVVDLEAPLLERVIVVQNGKSMSYGTPKCAIMKITASNLTEFSYSGDGYISHYLGLSNSSLAHNASLNVTVNEFPINKDPETKTRVFWLLKQFSQVKYLKFMGCEVLSQSRVAELPLFGILSQLELGLVSGEVLLGLLLKSPVLKTLLVKGISTFAKELLTSIAPQCLSSTLEVVKFHQVNGCEDELNLVKFFVENGLVLERMSFSLVRQLEKSKIMDDFKEKLFSFKRGFSFAFIEFTYDG